jgi:hypothetical protein
MFLIIIIVFFLITFLCKEMCPFASCIEELFSLYHQQREGRLCFFFFVLCFFDQICTGPFLLLEDKSTGDRALYNKSGT